MAGLPSCIWCLCSARPSLAPREGWWARTAPLRSPQVRSPVRALPDPKLRLQVAATWRLCPPGPESCPRELSWATSVPHALMVPTWSLYPGSELWASPPPLLPPAGEGPNMGEALQQAQGCSALPDSTLGLYPPVLASGLNLWPTACSDAENLTCSGQVNTQERCQ